MAQLKDLIVTGPSRFIGPTYGLIKAFSANGATVSIMIGGESASTTISIDSSAHYTPSSTWASKTLGSTAAGNFLKTISLDAKNHVTGFTSGSETTLTTCASTASNTAAAAVTAITVSGHKVGAALSNKVFSASTADSAKVATNLNHQLHIYQNGARIATYSGGTIISALTTDSHVSAVGNHYTATTATKTGGTTTATAASAVKGITYDAAGHIVGITTGSVLTSASDTATTYAGHYTPSNNSTATTSGARITGITKDGKGHIISIATAATDNTDTATTESGHYTPSTTASTLGSAGAGNFIKTITLDSKKHVLSITSGTAITAQTQLSYSSGSSVSNAASSVMTGLTVSNHAITYGKTNKIYSASTADSATIAQSASTSDSAKTSDNTSAIQVYTTAGSVRGVYTVSIPNVTALTDGMCFKIKLDHGYNGNWNSLKVNSLDAAPLWYAYGTRMTSHYSTNAEICVTYRTTATGTALIPTNSSSGLTSGHSYTNGFVIESNYVDGNNTYDNRPYYAYYRTDEKGVNAYNLCGLDINERLTPLVLSGGTGTTKPVNTKGFRPDKIYYASISSRVAANTTISHTAVYESVAVSTASYTFNAAAPVYTTIYLKGTLNAGSGLFYLSTGVTDFYRFVPYTAATPINLNDYFETGFYYIRVGRTYSTANYFYLDMVNPMFYYDGTNLIEVKPLAGRALHAASATTAGKLVIYENTSLIGTFDGSANVSALTHNPSVATTTAGTAGAAVTGLTTGGTNGHTITANKGAVNKLVIYSNGTALGTYDTTAIVSAKTTDEKVKSATGTTKAYILAHTGTAITNTAQTHANAYVTAGKVYSNNSETVNLADAQTVAGVKTFTNGYKLQTATSWTGGWRGIPFSQYNNQTVIQYVDSGFTYDAKKHLLKVSAITMNGTNAIQVPNKAGTIALTSDIDSNTEDLEFVFATAVNDLNMRKQDKLVVGENIKTINGQSILGEGNIEIQGGGGSGGGGGTGDDTCVKATWQTGQTANVLFQTRSLSGTSAEATIVPGIYAGTAGTLYYKSYEVANLGSSQTFSALKHFSAGMGLNFLNDPTDGFRNVPVGLVATTGTTVRYMQSAVTINPLKHLLNVSGLTMNRGTNIVLLPASKSGTIALTSDIPTVSDTKVTDSASSAKAFILGHSTQGSNAAALTNANCYISGGTVYSNAKKVSNLVVCSLTQTQYDALSTYDPDTLFAISGTVQSVAMTTGTTAMASTVTLNTTAARTYHICSGTTTSITLAGTVQNPGYDHYILFKNTRTSGDITIVPKSGWISTSTSFKVPPGGYLELSYVCAGTLLIITGSKAMTAV